VERHTAPQGEESLLLDDDLDHDLTSTDYCDPNDYYVDEYILNLNDINHYNNINHIIRDNNNHFIVASIPGLRSQEKELS
jgi:hypothetical protein